MRFLGCLTLLAGAHCLASCSSTTAPPAAPREPAASKPPEAKPSTAPPPASAATDALPSLDGFTDSKNHYENRAGDGYARHAPRDFVAIADNILLHQRDNGGWAENWDPQRILSEDEQKQLSLDRGKQDTSFDNRTTYTHVHYLAEVYRKAREPRHRDGCLRGIDFILGAQHTRGGFPHSYPGKEPYHRHVTFMDDVTPGVLTLLRTAATREEPFTFLDDAWRDRVARALERGERALLELQVVVNGKRTVWAGQYDSETLEPTSARSYELPGLVSRESLSVVRYLMALEPPTGPVVDAIEAAVVWFQSSLIRGLKIEEFAAPTAHYDYHVSHTDRRAVADPAAPPIWARFYEIETNRPFMANRDGKKVYALSEVERERRTGYAWYSYQPAVLLDQEYPAWQQRWRGTQ